MVKEIKAYRDASGTIHENALDAHRADLAAWLKKSGAIADPAPKMLVDWIISTHEMIDVTIEMLTAARAAMPARPTVSDNSAPEPRFAVELGV